MLADGYLELEYIQSSGTQHIDTGFGSTAGWTAEIDWMFTSTPSGEEDVIAAVYYANSVYWREYVIAKSGKWALGHYSNSAYVGSVSGGVKYHIKASTLSGNGYLMIDGTTIASYSTTYSPHPAFNVYLFAMHEVSSVSSPASGRMYSAKIWDENGVLIRDFVPAERVSDNAIGMYDRVSGAFYGNAGSGVFERGRYVNVTEDEIIKLEYIQSSGTQYIDTGFCPSQNTRVVAEMAYVSYSNATCGLFGVGSDSAAYKFDAYNYSSKYTFRCDSQQATASGAAVTGTKMLIDVSKTAASFTVDSTVYDVTPSGVSDFTSPYSIYIHALNRSGATYLSATRTHSFKIYDGDSLVRDYYPAKLVKGGAVGLWDASNNMLYTNAGTGVFVEGPEIPTDLPAPENLRATSVSESAITIEWDAVEDATGYKVFRNYVPVAEGVSTTYTDNAPEPYNGYVYAVQAYNDEMQSPLATVRVAAVGGDPILDLVTDRTPEDADYARRLAQKGLEAMTEDERTAFLGGLKGAYNATDLNRVESAVAFLPSFLNGIQTEINRYLASVGVAEDELYHVPYEVPVATLETKTDWSIADIPYVSDFVRYLTNIATAREWLPLPEGTPSAPTTVQRLTTISANAIEQILLAVYETALEVKAEKLVYADRAKDAWKYCGTFNCGQEVFF